MRYYFYLLFILLMGCESSIDNLKLDDPEIQTKVDQAINIKQLEKRDGLTYALNQEKPYTGWAKKEYRYYDRLYLLGHYQAGQKHGLWTYWDENRQKEKEENYQVGQKHGLWTRWYNNGQKKHEEDWPNGIWIGWDENGNVLGQGDIKNGNAKITYWHDNGQKAKEGHYQANEKQGLWTEWHKNGQKWHEGYYQDSEPYGLHTSWHENGQKWKEGYWQDSQRHGLQTYWDENGKKTSEIHYENGSLNIIETIKSNINIFINNLAEEIKNG